MQRGMLGFIPGYTVLSVEVCTEVSWSRVEEFDSCMETIWWDYSGPNLMMSVCTDWVLTNEYLLICFTDPNARSDHVYGSAVLPHWKNGMHVLVVRWTARYITRDKMEASCFYMKTALSSRANIKRAVVPMQPQRGTQPRTFGMTLYVLKNPIFYDFQVKDWSPHSHGGNFTQN